MEHWQVVAVSLIILTIILLTVAVVVFDAVNLVRDTGNQAIVEINNQSIIARVALNPESQRRGLSGFKTMAINQGMLFVFPEKNIRTFWMKDMNFPIDIVWIADRKVVGVTSNIPPEPGKEDSELTLYRSPEPVDWVLETRAGRSTLLSVAKGDEVFARPLIVGSLDFLTE